MADYPHLVSKSGSWYVIALNEHSQTKINGKRMAQAVLEGKPAPTRKARSDHTNSISVQTETKRYCARVRLLASVVEGHFLTMDKTVLLALQWFERGLQKNYDLSRKKDLQARMGRKLALPPGVRHKDLK